MDSEIWKTELYLPISVHLDVVGLWWCFTSAWCIENIDSRPTKGITNYIVSKWGIYYAGSTSAVSVTVTFFVFPLAL